MLKTEGGLQFSFDRDLILRLARQGGDGFKNIDHLRVIGKDIGLEQGGEICHLESALTVDLEGGDLKEFVKDAIGSIDTGMEDPCFHFFQKEMASFEQEVSFQFLQGGQIPGEFQSSVVNLHLHRQDMGIVELIAVINFWHLSRKLNGEDLLWTASLRTEKGIGNTRGDDPEGNKPSSIGDVEDIARCLCIQTHPFGSDSINLAFSPDLNLGQFDRKFGDLEHLPVILSLEIEVDPFGGEKVGKNLWVIVGHLPELDLSRSIKRS